MARLDPTALATAPLTYAEVGATAGPLPAGYHHVDRRALIGSGREAFDRTAEALFAWQAQRGAGLTVVHAPQRAAVGAVIVSRLGPPVVGLVLPCRVVSVVDEPHRRGFAYGTLPGHPESGEERFEVELGDDGRVELVIRAFSRPASLFTRLGGPIGRLGQRLVTDGYVRALRRVAQARG
jgi:uncharacterized protein (UPF0548 family)